MKGLVFMYIYMYACIYICYVYKFKLYTINTIRKVKRQVKTRRKYMQN